MINQLWPNIKQIFSTDNNVSKFVFTKEDAVVESVLYKYPTYEERTVICCSTQSGCPIGCRFCFMPGTLVPMAYKGHSMGATLPIEKIEVDNEVLGPNGWNIVTNIQASLYDGEMIEIELENNEKVVVTADHEMILNSGDIVKARNLELSSELK